MTSEGTAHETGTGLGLLICYEFVRKHEGKITVDSRIGYGSKFMFTLPRKQKQFTDVMNANPRIHHEGQEGYHQGH